MYRELDKMEKELRYYEIMRDFYKKALKGEQASDVPKETQRKNLKFALEKIKICKRRIREQKTLIKKLIF